MVFIIRFVGQLIVSFQHSEEEKWAGTEHEHAERWFPSDKPELSAGQYKHETWSNSEQTTSVKWEFLRQQSGVKCYIVIVWNIHIKNWIDPK